MGRREGSRRSIGLMRVRGVVVLMTMGIIINMDINIIIDN